VRALVRILHGFLALRFDAAMNLRVRNGDEPSSWRCQTASGFPSTYSGLAFILVPLRPSSHVIKVGRFSLRTLFDVALLNVP
jgi:hypothetical protein